MGADGEYASPGWARMAARLGRVRMEEMRLATIREQAEALRSAGAAPAAERPDRGGYRDYPPPRGRRRGKRGG